MEDYYNQHSFQLILPFLTSAHNKTIEISSDSISLLEQKLPWNTNLYCLTLIISEHDNRSEKLMLDICECFSL